MRTSSLKNTNLQHTQSKKLADTGGYNLHIEILELILLPDMIRYDIHKYSFSNRIIPLWNSLPEKVVSSSTVKSFKVRLDSGK